MGYASSDIASLRYLAANVIYQTTGALTQGDDESDRGVIDDAVLMMDVISSYHTESDPMFREEWAGIQKDRGEAAKALVGRRGMELDPSTQEAFRWRELKAQFRSLCRQGTFVRQDAPTAEWSPSVKVKA